MGKQELRPLREMLWLEQDFNIVLMGPSGTGKSYIAAGLCFDAIEKGYRAYFQTMESLVRVLKMKDMTRKAATEYKRITSAHLLVIDDIMMFPVTKQDDVAFFNLINELHDRASLIITTNKSPAEWADVLNDPVLTTATWTGSCTGVKSLNYRENRIDCRTEKLSLTKKTTKPELHRIV